VTLVTRLGCSSIMHVHSKFPMHVQLQLQSETNEVNVLRRSHYDLRQVAQ
jgi:hypothetical protein